ncbi:MAG: cation:dicarboxylase symporter family transporter [Bacteroidetes bacterium]|nr:cation:dicarboxylase symporter family transporter [Bacteroidota bacterium]
MFKKNVLIFSILIAMFLGVGLGVIINHQYTHVFSEIKKSAHSAAQWQQINQDEKIIKKEIAGPFSLLSDIFLRLIKMIIAPLVFSVLVTGIAKIGDFKTVGRMGIKTLLYFTSATLIALFLGLCIVNIFQPGKKIHMDLPSTGAESGIQAHAQTAKNFITHIIPESIVDSMAHNDILPIVVFALFFGIATASLGSKGKIIIDFIEAVSQAMFKVTDYVMKAAPIGVFGAVTAVVIQQGVGVLKSYAYLMLCFYGGLLFFVFVILAGICFALKINFFKLFSYIKEPVLLAFSTASSEAAMPQTIEQLEKYGLRNKTVSFVLPLGYSFNLDGSIMYMTFATLFIAQMYGIDISFADQVKMMLVLLVTSKGMAGVPRASLVVIAGMLSMFHIPVEGLLLLLGIDQLLDMGRSATNVVGNAVASAVIDKWEK